MEAKFRIFRGGPLTPWTKLCREAADYAAAVGPERVISISHSSDAGDGVVVVWYWARERRSSARSPRPST